MTNIYYQNDHIAIYNGDSVNILKYFRNKSIDLIITDPPYGIGMKYDNYDDTDSNWYNLMTNILPEIIRVSKMAILPSCQIKRLSWIYNNYPPDWLICWYKGSTGHASYIGFNDWEPHLVYGRRLNRLYMHDYFQTGSSPKKGYLDHPCPKPEAWADWLIQRVARDDNIVICDPFMGSGTVGYVARKYNHKFIGIDVSKKYCDISISRINEIVV